MSGSAQITNPNGAFGYTNLETKLFRTEAEFKTSAAIAGAPQVVAIGTDGTIAPAATDSTASLSVGIATRDAASGDTVKVVVYGIAENVPAAGAVTAGAILKRSATTTGSVSATASPAAGEAIGIAINASASNVVDVWVCKAV
jgi:hypothetical protein